MRREIDVDDAVDVYLERKSVGDPGGPGAGAYAANAESILRRWATWLEAEHGLSSLYDLEVEHMRAYAEDLGERTARGEYAPSTAGTYFAVVRAFLSWCVRGGILESNPAATEVAEAGLPPTDDDSGGQFWSAAERRALERYVRERSLAATDADRRERLRRLREYALVAILANAGVRGVELFRVPEDERRNGATWDDVDFYRGTVRVLGSSGRLEDVSLPAAARTPLRRYWIALDPPAPEWPLFPTHHAPSIASRVRSVLRERGLEAEEIDRLFAEHTATDLARGRAIAPPAITTEGARSILKRLCNDAGVDIDGDYLKPRGARRALDDDGRTDATTPRAPPREDFLERSIAVADRTSATDQSTESVTGDVRDDD